MKAEKTLYINTCVFGASGLGRIPELIRRYREDDPESKNSRVDHFLRLVNEKGMEQIREEGTAWLRDALSKNQ